jgi:hypothetical protein
MIFKKDNFTLGIVLGFIAPVIGFFVYKYAKFSVLSYKEFLQYLMVEPSHRLLTVAMSLSLLANAVVFTFYLNANKDKTAKGIFIATCIYGLIILAIKLFS